MGNCNGYRREGYGTNPLRRTKAAMIYNITGNHAYNPSYHRDLRV